MMIRQVEKFKDYLTYEKRASKHTVTAYLNDLNQFVAYLNAFYPDTNTLTEVGAVQIRSWLVMLVDMESCSAATLNRKISALKTFYKNLERLGGDR